MYMEQIDNMKIIKKLKECKMEKKYYSDLCNLVNHFAPILDQGALVQDTGFTPHDFSHHCRDIYEILGLILPDEFYVTYADGENLKLLLTAVLFHDIGMANDGSMESRRRHSEIGRKYVYDKMANNESALMDYMDSQLIEPLGDIIYAHSDIKSEDGRTEKNTFSEVVAKYGQKKPQGTYEPLNVPYLAAVLRLADELDISYSRIKGTGYEDKVNSDSSRLHYDICKYLKRVQYYNHEPGVLYIEVEEVAFSCLKPEESYNVAAQILEKYKKINREFCLVYNEVLSKNQYASENTWKITRVELKDSEKYLDLAKKKE